VSGTVKVNGRVVTSRRMLDVSGYVPQHDVLPGTLTVREHLLFHAKLRCPPGGTSGGGGGGSDDLARRARVHDVTEALGLGKCANTRIGGEFTRGLSGGEKRRVSVAEELVVEPGILFLDEPTTGLDSSTVRF
jgi:ABC-type multidrug transport system ATPase subunit